MSILEIKVEPFAVDVSFAADDLIMRLADGRQVSVPLPGSPDFCKRRRSSEVTADQSATGLASTGL